MGKILNRQELPTQLKIPVAAPRTDRSAAFIE